MSTNPSLSMASGSSCSVLLLVCGFVLNWGSIYFQSACWFIANFRRSPPPTYIASRHLSSSIGVWFEFPACDTCCSTFWHFFQEVKWRSLASLIDPFRNISSAFCLLLRSRPFSSASSLLSRDLLRWGLGVNFDFQLIPHEDLKASILGQQKRVLTLERKCL